MTGRTRVGSKYVYSPPLGGDEYLLYWYWTGLSFPRARSYHYAGWEPDEAFIWGVVMGKCDIKSSVVARQRMRRRMGERYNEWMEKKLDAAGVIRGNENANKETANKETAEASSTLR